MFVYCNNNPVNAIDPTGTAFIGIGAQFELSMGSYTCGIEVIIYWDETVCSGGGPVVSIYVYEGASFSINDALLESETLTKVISQLFLAIATNVSDGWTAEILAGLQCVLFGTSFSGSVLAIWGGDGFDSTDDYEGSFTSYSGNFKHGQLTYSYSDTCWVLAVGGTTARGWGFSFAQTNYTEIYSSAWVNKPIKGTAKGGGRVASPTKRSAGFFYYDCFN